MNIILTWVREIFMVILSITFLELLLPDGHLKTYVRFIFSITIMAVILEPVGNLIHN